MLWLLLVKVCHKEHEVPRRKEGAHCGVLRVKQGEALATGGQKCFQSVVEHTSLEDFPQRQQRPRVNRCFQR